MRLLDYFNTAASAVNLIITAGIIFSAAKARKHPKAGSENSVRRQDACPDFCSGRLYWFLAALMLAGGTALRFVNLAALPDGLQQDEASIGYEAYCLANYGIDRNGYHWPVYPITWGSGGGSPLMIYCNVLTTKLFGSCVTSIRMVPAFFGSLTLVLFFCLLLRLYGRKTALAGLAILSLTPWHLMLSRWSLDSNTAPFFELIAVSVFLLAAEKRKTSLYAAAAALSALCLYSYGSANIVIPLWLLFSCVYCIRRKRLTTSQLLISGAVFLLVLVPLIIFYAVNFLGLPEISTAYISFPKFTSSHFGSVFLPLNRDFPAAVLRNIKGLFLTLTFGHKDEVIWNMMPGYAALYSFTWPVTILGIAVCAASLIRSIRRKVYQKDAVLVLLLCSAAVFSLLIEQDINRQVFLFLPLVYCEVTGLRWLFRHAGKLTLIPALLFLTGALSFGRDYYGGRYNQLCAKDFMPGYGEAMVLADRLATGSGAHVYSTYTDVASPFMLTLYYTKYDPHAFLRTVKYKDPYAEFRVAYAFGHFTFGLPDKDLLSDEYKNDVFVLTKEEALQLLDEAQDRAIALTGTESGNFVVLDRQK